MAEKNEDDSNFYNSIKLFNFNIEENDDLIKEIEKDSPELMEFISKMEFPNSEEYGNREFDSKDFVFANSNNLNSNNYNENGINVPENIIQYNSPITDSREDFSPDNHNNFDNAEYNKNQVIDEVEDDENNYYIQGIGGVVPVSDEFPGEYNFQISLNSPENGKTSWMYSSILNKVFINMNNQLPVDFIWSSNRNDLFVRAMPMYELPQHAHEPVTRCLAHSSPKDETNRGVNKSLIPHVIRCNHPSAVYSSDLNDRKSVVTPLCTPQPGIEYVRITYTFVCKNSCTSGMNRRPIEIVFTLETPNNEIVGRRRLGVRICSCTKRDKEKEEQFKMQSDETSGSGIFKKRKNKLKRSSNNEIISNNIQNGAKKLKYEDFKDIAAYPLPQFQVVGRHNVLKILNYAYDIMAGDGIMNENIGLYQPYMDQIKNFLDTF